MVEIPSAPDSGTAAERVAYWLNGADDGDLIELEARELRALLAEHAAELAQLRAGNAALLDGNQRLQTMNDGLRRIAIEAREAAEGWHRATIDLYSGREEPHPADCSCGRLDEQAQAGRDGDVRAVAEVVWLTQDDEGNFGVWRDPDNARQQIIRGYAAELPGAYEWVNDTDRTGELLRDGETTGLKLWMACLADADLDARGQEGASCLCGCPLGQPCRCDDNADHGDPRDPEGWAR